MELGNLVAHYATKGEKGVEINLEALSQDKHFRSQAVQAVVKKVKENPHACVFFPSYKPAQIEELKAMGYDVSVLCLIAHSGAKVEAFAHENGVPVSAIVYTDEISYI